MFPITIPLILGLFIMLNAFQNPHSTAAVWGSIIPFTAPMVMVARVAYGVPAWQYILSVVLMIATFIVMAWLSSKIYRIGILSYGKKASWKDLFKWLKFKD
jgi:ABC-2 type transport system permease protein